MNIFTFVIMTLILLGISTLIWIIKRSHRRIAHIENYRFPPPLKEKVQAAYPHLNDEEIETVFEALRNYFLICYQTPLKTISMPSKVVDVAWHEFILATQTYHHFCQKSFGRYFHHSPDWESNITASRKLRNQQSWQFICLHDQTSPVYPRAMPLLFSIDEQLGIEDGFCYQHVPEKRNVFVRTLNETNDDRWHHYCKTPLLSEDDSGESDGDDADDNDDNRSYNSSDNDHRNGFETNNDHHHASGYDSGSHGCSGGGGCSSCSSGGD